MTFAIGKTLGAALIIGALATVPAQADGWGHRGGWGGHGWGGRGWGGHGWGHGGGWGGRGWRRHGGDWGGAVAAGALGALAAGAIAGAAARPNYGDAYGCYLADQPVYDEDGDIAGYRRVQVCN